MKYILGIACLVALQLDLSAQKIAQNEVPTAVKTSLSQMYPDANVTDWEIENGNYEASFTNGGVATSVLFANDGKFIQYEYAIGESDVPAAAKTYVMQNMKGQSITEMSRIKTPTGYITYELEVGGKDYLFDKDGVFLEMEEDQENDDK